MFPDCASPILFLKAPIVLTMFFSKIKFTRAAVCSPLWLHNNISPTFRFEGQIQTSLLIPQGKINVQNEMAKLQWMPNSKSWCCLEGPVDNQNILRCNTLSWSKMQSLNWVRFGFTHRIPIKKQRHRQRLQHSSCQP